MQRKNNIIAGAFLVIGVAVAVLLSFWVGQGPGVLSPRASYVMRFPISDGVAGIDEGAQVTLGGLPVGKVKDVGIHAPRGVPESIEVEVAIKRGISLREGARARVVTPLLGNIGSIDISSVGDPSAEPIQPGGTIPPDKPSNFLTQLGLDQQRINRIVEQTEEAATGFNTAVDRGNQLLTSSNEIVAAFAPEAEPSAQNFAAAIESLRGFADGIETQRAALAPRIDEVVADVRSLADHFPKIGEDASRLVGEGRALVENNRGAIDETIASARSITARIDDELAPRTVQLIDDGRDVVGDVQLLIDREAPGVSHTLANLQLISDRATVFFEEISSAPWRVLNRPENLEVPEEVIYNAARRYADAVARLRDASSSLDSVLEGVDGSGPSRALDTGELIAMRRTLQDAFERYREAEAELLRRFSGQWAEHDLPMPSADPQR